MRVHHKTVVVGIAVVVLSVLIGGVLLSRWQTSSKDCVVTYHRQIFGYKECSFKIHVHQNKEFRLDYQDPLLGRISSVTRLDEGIQWKEGVGGYTIPLTHHINPQYVPIVLPEIKERLVKAGEGKVLGYRCTIYEDPKSHYDQYWVCNSNALLLRSITDGGHCVREAEKIEFAPQREGLFTPPKDSREEKAGDSYILTLGLRSFQKSKVRVYQDPYFESPIPDRKDQAVYHTVFFSSDLTSARLEPDLYFMKDGELWCAGVIRMNVGTWTEDEIFMTPVDKTPKLEYINDPQTEGHCLRVIDYLNEDFLSLEEYSNGYSGGVHGWENDELTVFPVDVDGCDHRLNLKVLGKKIFNAFIEKGEETLKNTKNKGVDAWNLDENWGIRHQQGGLALVGRLTYFAQSDRGNYEDFQVHADLPRIPQLKPSLPWKAVLQKTPKAVDAVVVPGHMVVLTEDELQVYSLKKGIIGELQMTYSLEAKCQIVMVQWKKWSQHDLDKTDAETDGPEEEIFR